MTLSRPALGLLLLPALVLVACDRDEDDTGDDPGSYTPTLGSAAVCLAGPFEDPWSSGEGFKEDVEAVVVSDGLLSTPLTSDLDCRKDLSRVLELTDGDGETWQVSYEVLDDAGADVTPPLDVVVGQTVTLRFRATMSFGTAHGFSLVDEAGPVAELEVGTWGTTLDEISVVQVRPGEILGVEEDGCGPITHRELVFTGTPAVAGAPYERGIVSQDAVDLTFFAAAQATFEGDISCTDLSGTTMWAVFR